MRAIPGNFDKVHSVDVLMFAFAVDLDFIFFFQRTMQKRASASLLHFTCKVTMTLLNRCVFACMVLSETRIFSIFPNVDRLLEHYAYTIEPNDKQTLKMKRSFQMVIGGE